MQIKLKYLILAIIIIAASIGLYFFINLQMRIVRAINTQADFIGYTFPDQLKIYNEKIAELQANQVKK